MRSGLKKTYVIFSALYPPSMGGVEQFTQSLANEMVGEGDAIVVVTNALNREAEGLAREDGVNVLRLPCFPLLNGRMPVPKWGKIDADIMMVLDGAQPDGVLVNTRFYIHSLLGMRFAKRHGLTPVVLDHGSAFLTFGNRLIDVFVRFYERVITWLGRVYDPAYYGISKKSLEWLGTFGIEGRGVIPNAIDADSFLSGASKRNYRSEFDIDSSILMVAFSGRLIPEKGVKQLLEAMRMLENESIVLMMAGEGPLAAMVDDAGLSNVRRLGRLNRQDMAALLKQADLFCLPTRSEGFSTSVLEASACGVPCIVTDVGGVAELIPDESFGTVLNGSSPREIAGALRWALEHRSELRDQGNRCQEHAVKRYSWRSTAALVREAFESASDLDKGGEGNDR